MCKLEPKLWSPRSRITQIICQRIPDRRNCDTEGLKARRPALDSLWRVTTISSFWQTDRKCLRAISATNVYTIQKDTEEQWHASSDKPLHRVYMSFSLQQIKPMSFVVHHVSQTRIRFAGVADHSSRGVQHSLVSVSLWPRSFMRILRIFNMQQI